MYTLLLGPITRCPYSADVSIPYQPSLQPQLLISASYRDQGSHCSQVVATVRSIITNYLANNSPALPSHDQPSAAHLRWENKINNLFRTPTTYNLQTKLNIPHKTQGRAARKDQKWVEMVSLFWWRWLDMIGSLMGSPRTADQIHLGSGVIRRH